MSRTIVNPVLKDEVTFRQRSEETGGRVTCVHVKLMPGGGTPMHRHKRFEETFIVLTGELTIHLRKTRLVLIPGDEYKVKKNEAHCFINASSEPVEFSTVIRPGSTGFENGLYILYGLACDGQTRKDGTPLKLLELASISHMSDMHLAGSARLLAPVIWIMALIGRLRKLDERLIRSYCYGNSLHIRPR